MSEQKSGMAVLLSIGDFSRMTYLSVKALRLYHDMGLLVPAVIDPGTGYRSYEAAQVPVGQVIRRFRDLGMPLEQVREVLEAPDVDARNELIAAHLRRMEDALEQTQSTVASLRALLERPRTEPISVEYRTVEETPALVIAEPVAMADIDHWWEAAFAELHNVVASSGVARTGPDGALYPSEFFEQELGEVTAFVPVAGDAEPSGRVRVRRIPGAELAVIVHQGAFGLLDQAYGSLGAFVAQREIGVQGPIREHYIVSPAHADDESQHRTEVCWPVFQTRGRDR